MLQLEGPGLGQRAELVVRAQAQLTPRGGVFGERWHRAEDPLELGWPEVQRGSQGTHIRGLKDAGDQANRQDAEEGSGSLFSCP